MRWPLRASITTAERGEFAQKILDEVPHLPGVSTAASIHDIPYQGGWLTSHAQTDATRSYANHRQQLPEAQWQQTSGGYFGLMGIALVKLQRR